MKKFQINKQIFHRTGLPSLNQVRIPKMTHRKQINEKKEEGIKTITRTQNPQQSYGFSHA